MADTKTTALTALVGVIANDDLLAMVDTSASSTNKKITGALMRGFKVDSVIASGSITPNTLQLITLNLGTAIALTISGSPTAGDVLCIQRKGSGAVTHVVTVGGGITFDGTNNDANFDTDGDSVILIAESATRWIVFANNGVTFS
jgi:hypothetical protein